MVLLLFQIWRPAILTDAVRVGVFWLLLTVAFEFLFGHYIAKHSRERLLADYKVHEGRLWVLVLAGTAAPPPLCRWLLAG